MRLWWSAVNCYVSTCFFLNGTPLLRVPLGKPWVMRTHQSAAKDDRLLQLSVVSWCWTEATKPMEPSSILSTSANTMQLQESQIVLPSSKLTLIHLLRIWPHRTIFLGRFRTSVWGKTDLEISFCLWSIWQKHYQESCEWYDVWFTSSTAIPRLRQYVACFNLHPWCGGAKS